MNFLSIKKWQILNEGGNAIVKAERLTFKEAQDTFKFVKEYIIPRFNIDESDIDVIGSYGKKADNDTYGDLDIVIDKEKLFTANDLETDEDGLIFIHSILDDLNIDSIIYKGMVQVSSGVQVPNSNKVAQVDFMLSPSLEWSKFIYHSPHYKDSKYKGTYRNLLLAAITTEINKKIVKYTENGQVEELEQDSIRLAHGIYRNRRTWKGKRGLTKNPKILPDSYKLITRNPKEYINLVFGEEYDIKDLDSFESIWKIITSPNFKHYNKLNDIIKKFIKNCNDKKLEIPEEVKNYKS